MRPRWPGSSTIWLRPNDVTPSCRRSGRKRSSVSRSSRARATPGSMATMLELRFLRERLEVPLVHLGPQLERGLPVHLDAGEQCLESGEAPVPARSVACRRVGVAHRMREEELAALMTRPELEAHLVSAPVPDQERERLADDDLERRSVQGEPLCELVRVRQGAPDALRRVREPALEPQARAVLQSQHPERE